MRPRDRALVAAALFVAATACAPDGSEPPSADRGEPRDWAQRIDSGGGYPLAGASTFLDLPLTPVRMDALQGDTLGPGFRLFASRCAACHIAPDPGSKPAADWATVVQRMHANSRAAGLMPNSDEESATIIDFLERHGSTQRP